MAIMRVQTVLKYPSNLPRDVVSNQWAFDGPVDDATTLAISNAIKGFYDAIRSSTLSNQIAGSGHLNKFSVLPPLVPNYPFKEYTWAFATAPSATSLPPECAIVLSFQGTKSPGFEQARRRGRIYLGPCSTGASTGGSPTAATVTAIANAASAFKTAIDGIAGGVTWGVWSSTDQELVPIDNGWVDAEFDTQRSRGIRTTTRTTWN